jgi:hypothetical protein
MAKMIPLDPAPLTSLPVNGWRLVATEAGRYGDGRRATIQSHNGTLQDCYQLRLAHPKQWTACIEDVAPTAPAMRALSGLRSVRSSWPSKPCYARTLAPAVTGTLCRSAVGRRFR